MRSMNSRRGLGPRLRRRLTGQRGSSMVATPFAILVFAFLALGVIAFAQVLLAYQHLSGATRAAARYASKSDYDPTRLSATGARRPSTAEVKTYATSNASPLNLIDVKVLSPADAALENSDGAVGTRVRVRAEGSVDDGAYSLVTGLVNNLGRFFGSSQVVPFPFRIHSEAVALYE